MSKQISQYTPDPSGGSQSSLNATVLIEAPVADTSDRVSKSVCHCVCERDRDIAKVRDSVRLKD